MGNVASSTPKFSFPGRAEGSKGTSTPKSLVNASKGISTHDLFVKLVDVASEIKAKLDNLEAKILNQFDNITSRMNNLDAMP